MKSHSLHLLETMEGRNPPKSPLKDDKEDEDDDDLGLDGPGGGHWPSLCGLAKNRSKSVKSSNSSGQGSRPGEKPSPLPLERPSSDLKLGHGNDNTVVRPKEQTRVFFPDRNNKTRSAGQDLSEKQLLQVAETLGQEWEQAAIYLGLKTKDLDNIKAEHRTVAMQKQKMLVLWKRRSPEKATAQDLQRGLKDLEDLPVETRQLLKDFQSKMGSRRSDASAEIDEDDTITKENCNGEKKLNAWQRLFSRSKKTQKANVRPTENCNGEKKLNAWQRIFSRLKTTQKDNITPREKSQGRKSSQSGELSRIRSEFVKRVSNPVIDSLLDDLLHHKVLSTEEKDSVLEDQRSTKRARCLIDMVNRKGERASQIMIDSMKVRDPELCITLGLISSPTAE